MVLGFRVLHICLDHSDDADIVYILYSISYTVVMLRSGPVNFWALLSVLTDVSCGALQVQG